MRILIVSITPELRTRVEGGYKPSKLLSADIFVRLNRGIYI